MYTIIALQDFGQHAFDDVLARSNSYDEIRAEWLKLSRKYPRSFFSTIRFNLD